MEREQFYQTLIGQVPKGELSVAQRRQGFAKLMSKFPGASDIRMEPIEIGKLTAAWISAPHCSRDKVILFFHGGADSAGSFDSHQDLIGRMARATGCTVLAVNYRLAPEHPFPAAIEDAQAAYYFLLMEKILPRNIFLAGTSAGGGLILALLLKLKHDQEPLPRAAICICPWVDLALTGKTLKTNEGKDLIHNRFDVSGFNQFCNLTQLVSLCLHEKKRILDPKFLRLFPDTGAYQR